MDLTNTSRLIDSILSVRAAAALPQTGQSILFTVTGGRVRLISIIGAITANIGGVANDTQLLFGVTALCANLNITGAVAGGRFSITGTFGNPLILTLISVPLASQATTLVLPTGNLILDCDGSDGGAGRIAWTAEYLPLEPGAKMLPA